MRVWLLIDMDAIPQQAYDRLAADRRNAFPHPSQGVFAIAVDQLLASEATEMLIREHRIPRDAIRLGGG